MVWPGGHGEGSRVSLEHYIRSVTEGFCNTLWLFTYDKKLQNYSGFEIFDPVHIRYSGLLLHLVVGSEFVFVRCQRTMSQYRAEHKIDKKSEHCCEQLPFYNI